LTQGESLRIVDGSPRMPVPSTRVRIRIAGKSRRLRKPNKVRGRGDQVVLAAALAACPSRLTPPPGKYVPSQSPRAGRPRRQPPPMPPRRRGSTSRRRGGRLCARSGPVCLRRLGSGDPQGRLADPGLADDHGDCRQPLGRLEEIEESGELVLCRRGAERCLPRLPVRRVYDRALQSWPRRRHRQVSPRFRCTTAVDSLDLRVARQRPSRCRAPMAKSVC
jgi:hypothetical protein